MHAHVSRILHQPMTLTFWPQCQCIPRFCHRVYVYRIWHW